MKREHIKSGSYIDWLKSLGCLVYLPLSADSDLQDRISGLSLTFSGNGSMVWDINEGMYVVTGITTRNGYVALLQNGMNKNSFPTNRYSSLCHVKAIKRQSGIYMRTHSPFAYHSDTAATFAATYNGTGNTGSWPSIAFDFAYTMDFTNNRKVYTNGSLSGTYSSYSPQYPQNWQLQGDGFVIGISDQYGNGSSTKYSIQEVYIFNKVLDLQTIRKIQGYE